MPTFRGLFTRKDATRGTTPLEARLALAGLFTPNGDLGVVPGVLSGLAVAGVSAAWHYTVAAGHVVTTRGATDGATLFGLDGTTDTPTVAAAPASGSRWDLIWIRHRDVDGSDADSNAVLGVTEGTPSGTPSKPYGDVPSGALVLAEANVAAGATGTLHANVVITSVTPRVAARGGIIPSPSAAQMTALDSIATVANPIRVDDAGLLKRSVGAGWVVVGGVPSETVQTIAATTGAQTASAVIATATAIAAAPYDRVIELDGTINTSGIVAGAVWSGVLTSDGSLITTNVVDRVQFPILSTAAIGGAVKLYASVPLAAGATVQPRMWVLFGSGGQITVSAPSRLRVRVRRAI